MTKNIHTLSVIFDTDISYSEIPFFRGAVLKSLGNDANVLFHNHIGDSSYKYSYPFIQYKRLNGKATVTCVEEGIDQIGKILSSFSGKINLGKREVDCEVLKVISDETQIQVKETPIDYTLQRWLPLNTKNYELYHNTEELVDRIRILERILVGNILSFLKGVGIHLEDKITVSICDILNQKVINYKDIKLMSFDIKFESNILLPSYIGIGKNASIGCGLLTKVTNEKSAGL